MYNVPFDPPVIAEEMPPADRNGVIHRIPQIMMALWTVFFLYTCIAVGVELVETVEYYPQNLTFADDKKGLIHVDNSSNFSAGLLGQIHFIEFVHLYNDSWHGVDVTPHEEKEERAFNEVGDDDGSHSSQGFVDADKHNAASLRNSKEDGVLYNPLSVPDQAENGDSASLKAGASTTGDVDGFKNNYVSASELVFNEEMSSIGANSACSNDTDDGDFITVEVASTNSEATAPRANSTGSTSVSSRLAPEEAKSIKQCCGK